MKAFTIKSILVVAAWLTFTILGTSPGMASECIVSGETKVATIEYGGETHSYYFWAEAGQGVIIEMADNSVPLGSSAYAGLEPRVQLYDPDGVRVDDSGYGYARAIIQNRPLKKTGIYTIVVSDADAAWYGGREMVPDTGDYGLSMVLTGGTTTSLQDRDGGDMTIGRTYSGTIAPVGDLDAYACYCQAGQGVAIEMTDRSAAADMEPRVRLYDPHGALVADSGWDYSRARIENYQLQTTGIYTIVVSDADATWYGGGEYVPDTGEYGLSVSVMSPKDPHGLYPCDPQPADGNSVTACGSDALCWWPVDGATGYDVYFAAAACAPLEKVAENIIDPWAPMPAVGGGQICSWRVVAHTPSGEIQGPTWWFATEPCPVPSCGLTISVVGQGSIMNPDVGVQEYSCGEVVPITAVADPNYEFVRWEGSAVDANKVIIEYQDPTGSKAWATVDGAYTLMAVFEEIVHDVPLDVDPGWVRNGQWEFGMPTGQGGDEYGGPDPINSRTGQNVFGVNLSGDYDTVIGGPCSLVAGPFDLSGYQHIKLRFARWLNTDEPGYVTATVEVSTNERETWQNLWESEAEIVDSKWVLMDCPLGAEADGQPAVYVRWTYQVLRARAYPYSGWNLDDIQLYGRRQ